MRRNWTAKCQFQRRSKNMKAANVTWILLHITDASVTPLLLWVMTRLPQRIPTSFFTSTFPGSVVSSGANRLLPLSQFSSISILASNCKLFLLVIGYILFLCGCANCVLLLRRPPPKSLSSGLFCGNGFNCWSLFPVSSISILTSICRLSLLIFSNIPFLCGCGKYRFLYLVFSLLSQFEKDTRLALVWFNL